MKLRMRHPTRRGAPCRVGLLRKSRRVQRWFMHNPWTRPMLVFVFAALRIQQAARRYIVRKHGPLRHLIEYRNHRQQQKVAIRKEVATSQRQLDRYLTYLDRSNSRARQQGVGNSHLKAYSKPTWLDGGYSWWCAVRIQACWRGTKPRRRFLYRRRFVLQIATLIIQTAYRNRLEWKRQLARSREFSYVANLASPRRKMEMQSFAARRIQLHWRTFCNRRIFGYFRDLVCFKLQGAPSDLLKTIIPQETGLFDKAAGVHVRFRLGGAVFPPKVYFKIFTHRPLCDVNAFAPRDYTKESKSDAFHNNNYEKTYPKYGKYTRSIRVGAKYFGTVVKTSTTDMSSWYRREENNPWRPIASQLVEEIITPPWQQRDAPKEKKPGPFHYSTYKRREEVLRAKKRRKREWMLKAYLIASDRTLGTELNPSDLDDTGGNNLTEVATGWTEQKQLDAGTQSLDAQSKESNELELLWMDKAVLSHSEVGVEGRLDAELADLSLDDDSKTGWEKRGAAEEKLSNYNNKPHDQLQQHIRGGKSTIVEVVMPVGGNKGIAAALRAHRPNDDEDDEDLIDWSAALDFESYNRSWLSIGTSAPSSIHTEKRY